MFLNTLVAKLISVGLATEVCVYFRSSSGCAASTFYARFVKTSHDCAVAQDSCPKEGL